MLAEPAKNVYTVTDIFTRRLRNYFFYPVYPAVGTVVF